MTLNPETLQRIAATDWFRHAGESLITPPNMPVKQIGDWQEAPLYFHTPTWQNATLEAGNVLTQFLSDFHRKEYRQWNVLVVAAKEFLKTTVEPKIVPLQEELGFDKTFSATVCWSLANAIMEDAYSIFDPPTHFFRELLSLYEAGHFPCGWIDAEWPQGRLVVL